MSLAVMGKAFKTSGEGVRVALVIALFAASATNLVLVCSLL
jgi:hypothetical protein